MLRWVTSLLAASVSFSILPHILISDHLYPSLSSQQFSVPLNLPIYWKGVGLSPLLTEETGNLSATGWKFEKERVDTQKHITERILQSASLLTASLKDAFTTKQHAIERPAKLRPEAPKTCETEIE